MMFAGPATRCAGPSDIATYGRRVPSQRHEPSRSRRRCRRSRPAARRLRRRDLVTDGHGRRHHLAQLGLHRRPLGQLDRDPHGHAEPGPAVRPDHRRAGPRCAAGRALRVRRPGDGSVEPGQAGGSVPAAGGAGLRVRADRQRPGGLDLRRRRRDGQGARRRPGARGRRRGARRRARRHPRRLHRRLAGQRRHATRRRGRRHPPARPTAGQGRQQHRRPDQRRRHLQGGRGRQRLRGVRQLGRRHPGLVRRLPRPGGPGPPASSLSGTSRTAAGWSR